MIRVILKKSEQNLQIPSTFKLSYKLQNVFSAHSKQRNQNRKAACYMCCSWYPMCHALCRSYGVLVTESACE